MQHGPYPHEYSLTNSPLNPSSSEYLHLPVRTMHVNRDKLVAVTLFDTSTLKPLLPSLMSLALHLTIPSHHYTLHTFLRPNFRDAQVSSPPSFVSVIDDATNSSLKTNGMCSHRACIIFCARSCHMRCARAYRHVTDRESSLIPVRTYHVQEYR